MSLLLDSYRRNAAAALEEAEQASLPNVRARAIDAAARWTELADRLEWVEAQGQSKRAAATQGREGGR